MDVVANMASEHACELIFKKYTFAMSKASYEFYEDHATVFLTKNNRVDDDNRDEPTVEYKVEKTTWACSCLFMLT